MPAWAEEVLRLQRLAGNRAVVLALQRVGGWSDAAKDGKGTDDRKGWNEGEHRVGSIRRIPIEGLGEGNQRAWQSAGSASAALTEESAAGRAIALVPADLAPGKDVDVLLFFHGYAETTERPYAGWRQRTSDRTVRDVAQDHMEQQLQGSGATQMIGVLAQGGEQSEFGGKGGRTDFDPDAYIGQVLHTLETIGAVNHPLNLGRVIMAAHSGGGHLIRSMEVGEGRAHMPGHLGELVLFDAINNAQELKAAKSWISAQLDADLRALADPNATDETKKAYLSKSIRLRAYHSSLAGYTTRYRALEKSINRWFDLHAPALGSYAGELRTHYQVVNVGGGHEALMRGRGLKDESDPTHGSVSDAITALYHPEAAARNKAEGVPTSKPPKTRSRRGKAATTGSAAATSSGGRSAAKNEDLAKAQPELAAEYQRLNTPVRQEFDHHGGLSAYITLRPLYAQSRHLKGAAPVDWLNLLDFSYTFCGFKLAGLHPSVTARLDKIQEACNKLVPSVRAAGAPVKFEGAFQPRKTTDKDTLSDHALGLALHLNYPSDPYLGRLTKSGNASAPIIASIVARAGQADFWHGVPKKKGESREAHIVRAYQTLASASDAVAAYFSALDDGTLSPEETAKRTKEYEIVKAANSGGDPKLRDPKRGFYAHTAGGAGGNDPMLELVKLLTLGAELQWGGEYNSRPFDLHHFALKKP